MPVVVVVIPALNEENSIQKVIESMPAVVKYIIVVDDASRDHTSAIAERASAVVIPTPEISGLGPPSSADTPTP